MVVSDTTIDSITVNFALVYLSTLSGWTVDEIEGKEGELDFFLDQEMNNEFPEASQSTGNAFYAGSNPEFQVDAFDMDNNPLDVDRARLERVAKAAIKCIKMAG